MLTNKKLILIYGFSNDEIKILQGLDIPSFKIITKEVANMKVTDIVQGLKFEIYPMDLPDERLILFNNLDDNELNDAIKSIRQKLSKDIILAVVTPTSEQWIFKELLEHLIGERDWHKKVDEGI